MKIKRHHFISAAAIISLPILLLGGAANAATADDRAAGIIPWQLRDDIDALEVRVAQCEEATARITALEVKIRSLEGAAANSGSQEAQIVSGNTEGLERRVRVLEQVISMMEVGQGSLHARIDQAWAAVRTIQKLLRLPVQP